MSLRTYPARLLFGTTLFSLLILALTIGVAVYLNREQDRTADILGENILSRRAAINMEEALVDLIALHRREARDVEPIQDRVIELLSGVRQYADKPREKELALELAASYRSYQADWTAGDPLHRATAMRRLDEETLRLCRELRDYNVAELDASEQEHRESLRLMAWGLVVVGILGSLGGLLFGYSLARRLRRTIHQFLFRVQGATDRLGMEVPAVEWEREGEPLADGGEDLFRRVEQVVERLQQQEREVRRAERLAALGQLAAGLAHEIRNPLTSALLLLETSRKDPAAGGLTDEELKLIEDELHRIEESLRVFLDYARPPKLHQQLCDLAEIARDALALVRGRLERQRVVVRWVAGQTGPAALIGDSSQLRQVVLNLILNALDVMPHGGTLSLALRPGAVPGTIELTITDTGPGIAAEMIPRLFEPFATGKETGLGLGLVIARRIVEDHEGRLSGYNTPEGGACFAVTLPGGQPS